ncbi:MAG: hypothetical protein LZF60_80332 [Nitrospira sp.]|nr:MAG: hypothetical protein LZF60_80332 [Nitrospira sp.]
MASISDATADPGCARLFAVQSRDDLTYQLRTWTSLWFSVCFSPNINTLPDGTVPQEA